MTIKTTKGVMTSGKVKYQGSVYPIKEVYIQKDGKKQLIFSGWYWNTGNTEWKFAGHTNHVQSLYVDSKGYVYSGGADNTLIKISPQGEEVWRKKDYSDWIFGLYVDKMDNIYTASADKTVRKISPDGKEIWSFSGHTGFVRSVVVDSKGYVYSGSNDKTVRKISPDGKEIWKLENLSTVPVIKAKKDYIYYICNNAVVKLNSTKEKVWRFEHAVGLNDLAVLSNDCIYLASNNNVLTKLDMNGEKVVDIPMKKYIQYITVDKKNYIYFSAGDNNFKKINKRGEILWTTNATGEANIRSIAVDNFGKAYIGDSRGNVWKIG